MNRFIFLVFCLLFICSSLLAQKEKITINDFENKWKIENLIFEKGSKGSFDEVSVKDPSIVFFENAWHLFYTARGKNEYTTGYVSTKELNGLNSAPRFELKQIRGKTRYGCAPQVFYFEPQNKWYLIFQNRDANYQPAFSTTETISKSETWSAAKPLIQKDKSEKWIDFWVMADETKVYLFYTEAHSGVVVRSTSFDNFPGGWNEGVNVFDDVHEAVHIYKVADANEFHMIYELNNDGNRSFGLAKANHLEGPWERVSDSYATGNQLKYGGNSKPWTEMVSHGEAIRTGYNQKMEYHPDSCSWLIQGIMKKELTNDYPSLPWKLGVIKQLIYN
ncbi:MAG: hypothetical protein HQ522_21315 [Bacteroidetes bacterium]|nr:hypothetical protein [Bacteroidota bacterium]